MKNQSDFKLELPRFTVCQRIPKEILDDEIELNRLQAILKEAIKNHFMKWLENDFQDYFAKEVLANKEKWKKDEYSFAEKLIHKIN